MDTQTLQILLDLARTNSEHIAVLNREMGGVQADLAIIKWFLMINVIAWVGLLVSQMGGKLFKKNKNA